MSILSSQFICVAGRQILLAMLFQWRYVLLRQICCAKRQFINANFLRMRILTFSDKKYRFWMLRDKKYNIWFLSDKCLSMFFLPMFLNVSQCFLVKTFCWVSQGNGQERDRTLPTLPTCLLLLQTNEKKWKNKNVKKNCCTLQGGDSSTCGSSPAFFPCAIFSLSICNHNTSTFIHKILSTNVYEVVVEVGGRAMRGPHWEVIDPEKRFCEERFKRSWAQSCELLFHEEDKCRKLREEIEPSCWDWANPSRPPGKSGVTVLQYFTTKFVFSKYF